jgi:hypothetical protein
MPARKNDLHLHEQVLLLALRDEKGTVESKAGMYRCALGGAVLAELLLEGRIAVAEGKRKLVNLVDSTPTGDAILDEALGRVAAAKRRRAASSWVSSFAGIKKIRHRTAEGLCRRGILRDSEDSVLLIFRRKVYPTIDPTPERRLVEKMRKAVASDSQTIEPRIGVVVALAHATGLLRVHLDRKTLKGRKRRLEKIVKGDLVGGATREAVEAAQAAAVAATIVSSVVVTSAANR